jgi:carboxyl-terminal processing protease
MSERSPRTSPPARAAAVLLAAAAAACAPGVAPAAHPAGAPIEPALALATFDSAWSRIHNTYYDTTFKGMSWTGVRDELRPRVERATHEEEVRDAIREMLDRIGDSHFALIPRQAADAVDPEAVRDGQGTVPADAGVELRLVEGGVTVFRVDPRGAAAAAGVRPGWVLTGVGRREVAPWLEALGAVDEARARGAAEMGVVNRAGVLLQGPEGRTVTARFADGAGARIEREITLRPVAGEAVRFGNLPTMFVELQHERLGEAPDCIGVVRFNVWMPAIREPFGRAMDALAGCRGIVVDLRGNPGGAGGLAMGVAGAFIDETVPFGVMRTRQQELRFVSIPRRVTADLRPTRPFAGPLAILVDGHSASTSEIFAAGMQAIGRARVFGQTSPGMALPAMMLRLPNQDVLYHAFADFTDPDGVRIEGRGAVPDVPVALTRADLLAGRDRVQDAAIRWIRGETNSTENRP